MSIKLINFYTTLNLTQPKLITNTLNKLKQTLIFFNYQSITKKRKHTTYYKTVRKNLGYPINGQRTHTNAKMSFFLKTKV